VIADEIPEDVLAALNDPEAFESLTDDFIVAAEDETADNDGGEESKKGKRKPSKRVHFDDEDEEDVGEHDEEDYDEDEDDEDLEALLAGLKANPEGNKRRVRNEHEQVFDARFERVRALFSPCRYPRRCSPCSAILITSYVRAMSRLWLSSTTTKSASCSRKPRRSRE
jgi:hypothetical protein